METNHTKESLRKIFEPVNICGVIDKILKLADQAIWFSYLALAVVTPLIFSTKSSELFEVPKMIFVYFVATIILTLTLLKFILQKKILIPKSWPLMLFIIFLICQSLSTFFSIDKFTSVFGYPSRLNGGLLSQFAYFVIFASALVHLNFERSRKLLVALVASALAVTLWGIPAHFGKDPSCFVLTGKFTSTCWQREFDPQLRIFSTLGQPNWLASYLVIILPISIALMLSGQKRNLKIFFLSASLILFTALVMTTSRAGLLGFLVTAIIFLLFLHFKTLKQNGRHLIILAVGYVIITLLFGNFLFSRIGEALNKNQKINDQLPGTSYQELVTKPSGGTESGTIRLIVWQGAFEIFKKWPILGSGPETFAYSYYLFRPTIHNQTTEWNFFYNKAHNEFLNYLANVGTLGTLAYLSFLSVVIWQLYKRTKGKPNTKSIIIKGAIVAIIGYQTTIFFGFSVVASQLIMFLTISSVSVSSAKKDFKEIKLNFLKRTGAKTIASFIVIIAGLYCLIFVGRIYFADILINSAQNLESSESLVAYSNAIAIFPTQNPFYLADCTYESALYVTSSDSPETSKQLTIQSDTLASSAIALSPNNLIVARKVANAYLLISSLDAQYTQRALDMGQRLVVLAPTDPQSYLTFAKIQIGLGRNENAKKTLETTLSLKPDYEEAKELMEQLTTNN